MKRLILLFFSALLCTAVSAHDFEVDGIYYDIKSDTDLTVSVTYKGSGSDSYSNEYTGSVVIPEKITFNNKEYSVTSIGENAFYDCSGLTSVTIPNSVTSIGAGAFYVCYGLTAVHITDLSAWCKIKFDGLSSNPTYYAHHLYLNGDEIINLVIPNDVTSIGNYAFCGCSDLTSVSIPNSVTSIGNYAFYECYGLTAVHITDLSAWCKIKFYGWSSNPTNYAHHLYLNGDEIINLVIPDDVTSIGEFAFYGYSGLTSVTIPNSVNSIGDAAFFGCSELTSVTIPNSVTSIGEAAFSYCSGLTSVTIPNAVTSIGDYAFSDCYGLTSVTIPNSVTSIENGVFYKCSGLTSVTIPNSVTSIGSGAFSGCSGLTSVTIPNSVTSIGNGTFSNCSGLTSIDIPKSVTSIEYWTFRGCSGLTSVTIPNSVTSIGESAFYNCYGLTSIYIPESVTRISQEAFFGCSSITRIDCMAATPPLVYNKTFSSEIYTKATLNVPEGSVEKYKVANIWKEFTNISVLGASTGIKQIESAAASSYIYDINGNRIGKNCDEINNLKRGIYITGGKKVYIR